MNSVRRARLFDAVGFKADRDSFKMEQLENRILYAAGDVDSMFGTDGRFTQDVAHSDEVPWATAQQSDGKVLIAGWSDDLVGNRNGFVVRITADGLLDTTFADHGIFRSTTETVTGIAVKDNGQIVVGGQQWFGAGSANYTFQILDADGTVDQSFGEHGTAQFDIARGPDFTGPLVVTPDGKILATARSFDHDSQRWGLSIIRVTSDGSLDRTFSDDGVLQLDSDRNENTYVGIGEPLVLNDGKILVPISTWGAGSGLLRLCADGSFDQTFGVNGVITDPTPSVDGQLTLLSDGKVLRAVAAGSMLLTRYNPDGTLDTTFGNGGYFLDANATGDAVFYSTHVLSDGSIQFVGIGVEDSILRAGIVSADGTLLRSAKFDLARGQESLRLQSPAIFNADGTITLVGYAAPQWYFYYPSTDDWWDANDIIATRVHMFDQADTLPVPPIQTGKPISAQIGGTPLKLFVINDGRFIPSDDDQPQPSEGDDGTPVNAGTPGDDKTKTPTDEGDNGSDPTVPVPAGLWNQTTLFADNDQDRDADLFGQLTLGNSDLF